VVAAAVNRAIAGSIGVVAACLMAGLLGIIAITGRWPVDAPRTHLDTAGILRLPAEGIVAVEFSAGEQQSRFSRRSAQGWLLDGRPTGPAAVNHIETAVRLLTVSAPRRTLAAGDYNADQLAEYGLDPPRFVLSVVETGGSTRRLDFGEATPAQNAQYVRIDGRPELYLLPRDVGEEWQLARDMAERPTDLLLPVSIAQVWAIEIISHGVLCRFERDPAGLWFHHVGQHIHTPGGLVHHADPKVAPLIEAELAKLDCLPVARVVASHPDGTALASAGFEHPTEILLLYSRDSAGPVARVELGNTAADRPERYARIVQNDNLVIVADDATRHLATLLQLAGPSS
jgi:Domain of unknown function (DUF4340)